MAFSLVAGSFSLNCENCIIIKYADDFTFCSRLIKYSLNTHIVELNNAFLKWTKENGLIINNKKCKALILCLEGRCPPVILPHLSYVQELRMLDVTLNDKLNWNRHIDSIVKRVSQRLYVLRQLKEVVPRSELLSVCNDFVRSVLESSMFVGLSTINATKFDRIQRRCHRLLCGSGVDISVWNR